MPPTRLQGWFLRWRGAEAEDLKRMPENLAALVQKCGTIRGRKTVNDTR